MPLRICKSAIEYPPCHSRTPGEEFEVEENHINVLVAAGFIEPDAPPAPEVEYLEEPPESHEEISGTLHARRGKAREQRGQSAPTVRNTPRPPETL